MARDIDLTALRTTADKLDANAGDADDVAEAANVRNAAAEIAALRERLATAVEEIRAWVDWDNRRLFRAIFEKQTPEDQVALMRARDRVTAARAATDALGLLEEVG